VQNLPIFRVLRPAKAHKYKKAVSKERVVKTHPLPGAKILSKITEHYVFAQSCPPKVPPESNPFARSTPCHPRGLCSEDLLISVLYL
jgi:hypothetical protein